MKKLLIVSYMFPPISGAGTQRPLKFTKYLPHFGIEPVVYCPRYARWKAEDLKLLDQAFLKTTSIYRCGIQRLRRYYRLRYDHDRRGHPYYYLLAVRYIWFLDFFSAWYFECRHRVLDIVRREKIDCIFTTSPPHSVHLFGFWIKRKCGIPWIMDLRDAMVDDPNRKSNMSARFQKTAEYYYEKKFYRTANVITTVSEPISHSIQKRHETIDLIAKLNVIPNGFDEDDFPSVPNDPVPKDKFTITYTGSFMGKRTPEFFLRALQSLKEKGLIDPQKILLRFAGHYNMKIQMLLKSYAKELQIEVLGFRAYKESIELQKASDLLLLIVPEDDNEDGSQMLTGKFFEYIGVLNPIFALVPSGPLKQIIEEGRFGVVVPPENIDRIAKAFENLYYQWKNKTRIDYEPDLNLRKRFTRRRSTDDLASIVKKLCTANF